MNISIVPKQQTQAQCRKTHTHTFLVRGKSQTVFYRIRLSPRQGSICISLSHPSVSCLSDANIHAIYTIPSDEFSSQFDLIKTLEVIYS
jgi:hypothetical protein